MSTAEQPGSRAPLPPPRSRAERLITLAAGLLALFAVVIAIGLFSLDRANRNVMQEVQRTRDARLAAYALMQASIDAETGQRGFLLTNDREFLAPYDSGRAAVTRQLQRLDELTEDHPALHSQFEVVQTQTQSALDTLSTTIERRRAGTLSPREFRTALSASKDAMDSARAEISTMMQLVEGLIDGFRVEERRTRDALFAIGGLLAVLALISVAATLLMLRAEQRSWRAAYASSEAARQAALASERAKSRFLAVASHDMRQPLHALTLYLTALERRVETEEARGIVAKMERAVHSMSGMFTSLLELARLQAGVVAPEIAETSLRDVIAIAAAEHPPEKVSIEVSDAHIRTDERLLARLISNLIANAIRHGGGAATIEARAENGAALITVSDQGPGIAPADHERIFAEFERLDAGAEGLGLGLPIVRKLAELLDASLTIQSSEGQGARFTIRLQQAHATPAAAPASTPPDVELLHGATVLVMDDDALAREAIAGLLSDLKADVRACADGAEAEALLRTGFAPQLLVLDLRIRGKLSGLGIADTLTARIDPPPRTIMVTGDVEPETLEALRQSGYGWLIKPVAPDDLRAAAAAQLRCA